MATPSVRIQRALISVSDKEGLVERAENSPRLALNWYRQAERQKR